MRQTTATRLARSYKTEAPSMTHSFNQSPRSRALFQHAPTRSVDVGGTAFVYRELGPKTGAPAILLRHLGAQLDNFDPRIIDGLAATRRVIAFDNRGVGASVAKLRRPFPRWRGMRSPLPGRWGSKKSISSASRSAALWRRRLCLLSLSLCPH